MTEHIDVLIIGAGISGIDTACRLRDAFPSRTLAVLESREQLGGTWDLFRYPGVRSDSDMFTLGFPFRPWTDRQSIARGADIRTYLADTVRERGLDALIRCGQRVVAAEFSCATATWTVTVEPVSGPPYELTCSFLQGCTGYYDYESGYQPGFPGQERFSGPVVHPQHWPQDLSVAGRRVVVIGSGATAVTLIPALVELGAEVTMLQRTPTFVAARPGADRLAGGLSRVLPTPVAAKVVLGKNIAFQTLTYQLARRRPDLLRRLLVRDAQRRLGDNVSADTHFNPSYQPWDQRLCLAPDGDLFRVLGDGRASVVTETIRGFTEDGIELGDGSVLPADIIVTATGLRLKMLGGMRLSVDGVEVRPAQTWAYKGVMLSGVPNFALTIGYVNASWTLRADLVARWLCRLLALMDERHWQWVAPPPPDLAPGEPGRPLLELAAGYIRRDLDVMPRQLGRAPWVLHQNYHADLELLIKGPIDDELAGGRIAAGRPVRPAPPGDGRPATIDVGGFAVRYRSTGSGSPLLAVHGIGRSLHDWDEQHRLLADRFRVISLDLPGFGGSERPDAPVTLGLLARAADGLLTELGITESVTVLGNSLGGAVAMELAVAHPERVAGLVLVDSAGFGAGVTGALRMLAVPGLGRWAARAGAAAAKATTRSLFHDPALATPQRVAHTRDLARRSDQSRTLLDLVGALGTVRGIGPQWRRDLLDRLRPLHLPTLVIWGADDRVLPAGHLAEAGREFPFARTVLLPRAGHMPQIELAGQVAALIEEFVSGNVGTAASTASEQGPSVAGADRAGSPGPAESLSANGSGRGRP